MKALNRYVMAYDCSLLSALADGEKAVESLLFRMIYRELQLVRFFPNVIHLIFLKGQVDSTEYGTRIRLAAGSKELERSAFFRIAALLKGQYYLLLDFFDRANGVVTEEDLQAEAQTFVVFFFEITEVGSFAAYADESDAQIKKALPRNWRGLLAVGQPGRGQPVRLC